MEFFRLFIQGLAHYFPRFVLHVVEFRPKEPGQEKADWNRKPAKGDFIGKISYFNFFGRPLFVKVTPIEYYE